MREHRRCRSRPRGLDLKRIVEDLLRQVRESGTEVVERRPEKPRRPASRGRRRLRRRKEGGVSCSREKKKEAAMFDRKFFAGMRREGLGVGISKGRLSEALLEILVQLPEGITRLKETCVHHLGLIGPMSAVRDIDAAWTQTKKRAAREYPDKFTLDDHGVLHWAGRAPRPLDKKISRETFEKLNEMAEEEGCSVNSLVTRLIKAHRKGGG
jgi:hypothetical protein